MSVDTPLWDEREERLVRFLLGDVSPDERSAVEDRLFDDRGFLDEVLAVGDDLIDAYLAGSLSKEDRSRFETHFLASPLRRQRFELVRDMVAVAQETSKKRPPTAAPRGWLLVAAALIAALGLLLVARPRTPEERSARSRDAMPRPSVSARTPSPEPPVETRVVRLPARRSSDPVEVDLTPDTRTVRLEIPIAEVRHPTYDAVIEDTSGASVWKGRGLVPAAAGEPLIVAVPTRVLVASVYTVRIEGERLRDAPRQAQTSLRYTLHITR